MTRSDVARLLTDVRHGWHNTPESPAELRALSSIVGKVSQTKL